MQGNDGHLYHHGDTGHCGKRKSMLTAMTYRSTRSLVHVFVCLKWRAVAILIMHGFVQIASAFESVQKSEK